MAGVSLRGFLAVCYGTFVLSTFGIASVLGGDPYSSTRNETTPVNNPYNETKYGGVTTVTQETYERDEKEMTHNPYGDKAGTSPASVGDMKGSKGESTESTTVTQETYERDEKEMTHNPYGDKAGTSPASVGDMKGSKGESTEGSVTSIPRGGNDPNPTENVQVGDQGVTTPRLSEIGDGNIDKEDSAYTTSSNINEEMREDGMSIGTTEGQLGMDQDGNDKQIMTTKKVSSDVQNITPEPWHKMQGELALFIGPAAASINSVFSRRVVMST